MESKGWELKKKEQEKKALRRRGGKDKAKEVQISISGK